MAETTGRLAGRLQVEGEKVVQFFQSLAPEDWGLTVYTDGACWTVRQVLAHFVMSEISMGQLVENILAGGTGTPEDFDLNAYNERKVTALEAANPAKLLEQYTVVRRGTVERMRTLVDADLLKTGRHPFLGIAPVEEIVKLIYRHNSIHLREIRRALA